MHTPHCNIWNCQIFHTIASLVSLIVNCSQNRPLGFSIYSLLPIVSILGPSYYSHLYLYIYIYFFPPQIRDDVLSLLKNKIFHIYSIIGRNIKSIISIYSLTKKVKLQQKLQLFVNLHTLNNLN